MKDKELLKQVKKAVKNGLDPLRIQRSILTGLKQKHKVDKREERTSLEKATHRLIMHSNLIHKDKVFIQRMLDEADSMNKFRLGRMIGDR